MTSSDMEQAVSSLLALLDERRLRAMVDEPLEQAAASFHWPEFRERNFWAFRELVIAFRQHLDLHAFGRSLGAEDSYAESIGFLDQLYPRRAGNGHEAAFWEFCQAVSGSIERITGCLVRGVRDRERTARVRHALVKHLPQTWEARCGLAQFVLERFEMAESIRNLTPARLADLLGEIISGQVQAENHVHQLVREEMAITKEHQRSTVAL